MARRSKAQTSGGSDTTRPVLPVIAAAVLILLSLLILATSGSRTASQDTFSLQGSPLGPAGLSVPAVNAVGGSSSWYCVWPESAKFSGASGEIVIANVTATKSVVRLFKSEGVAGAHRAVRIPANSVVRVPMSEFSTSSGGGGVSILSSGGQIAVGMSLTTAEGGVLSPCQSSPGFYWVIQGGSTLAGSTLKVAIFNPFPNPSVLDVRLLAPSGSTDLGSLQGIIVPSGQTSVLDIGKLYAGHRFVIVEIRARAGRVVASGLVETSTSTLVGANLLVGVNRPSPDWYFPQLFNSIGITSQLLIFNPSSSPVRANVKVLPAQGRMAGIVGIGVGGSKFSQVVEPESMSVIDLTSFTSLPSSSGYGISVTDSGNGLVVSSQLTEAVTGKVGREISELGTSVPAADWLVVHLAPSEPVGFSVMNATNQNLQGTFQSGSISDLTVKPAPAGKASKADLPITVLRDEVLLQNIGSLGPSAVRISLEGKAVVVPVSGAGLEFLQNVMSFPFRG